MVNSAIASCNLNSTHNHQCILQCSNNGCLSSLSYDLLNQIEDKCYGNVSIEQTEQSIFTETMLTNKDADKELLCTISKYSALTLLILLLIVCGVILYCMKRSPIVNMYKAWRGRPQINNALVAIIPIGQYNIWNDADTTYDITPNPQFNKTQDKADTHERMVKFDVIGVKSLFASYNYKVMNFGDDPVDSPGKQEEYQLEWTEAQVLAALRMTGRELIKGGYDALILFISCHGWSEAICTSDYRYVEKHAIHGLFSAEFPECKDIPRFFFYDCCSGSARFQHTKPSTEATKIFQFEALMSNPGMKWSEKDIHPFNKLVTVHGSTKGFMSMGNDLGSHKIRELLKQFALNRKQNPAKRRCLLDLLKDVEETLYGKNKQLLHYNFQNGMDSVIFLEKKSDVVEIPKDHTRIETVDDDSCDEVKEEEF